MASVLPKIKPSAKLTQVDDATYSISNPNTGRECVLDQPGYLVLEELEEGDKTLEDIAGAVSQKYGIHVSIADLEHFLRQLSALDLLENSLDELGLSPVEFPEGSLSFRPGTQVANPKEIEALLSKSGEKVSLLKRYDRKTWAKLLFGVFLFLMPWPRGASGPAEILPFDDRDVRSEVDGKIEEVLVREGQPVAEGAMVVRLEGYRDQIDRKKAEIGKVEAELEILRRGATLEEVAEVRKQFELARQIERQAREKKSNFERLSNEGLVSKQEFDDIESTWKIHVKELENMKAKLDLIEKGTRPERIQAKEAEKNALLVDLKLLEDMNRQSQIASPIRGVVATPDTEKLRGKFVHAGETILKVSNPETITILTEIGEGDLGELQEGLELSFKIQALPSETFHAKVTRISPIVEQSKHHASSANKLLNRVVRVYADLKNPDPRILPGMTGTATIPLGWNALGFTIFYDAYLSVRLFLVI